MNGFAAKLRLKEMAEEDIYFARLDQELIEALRQKKRELESSGSPMDEQTEQPTEASLVS